MWWTIAHRFRQIGGCGSWYGVTDGTFYQCRKVEVARKKHDVSRLPGCVFRMKIGLEGVAYGRLRIG